MPVAAPIIGAVGSIGAGLLASSASKKAAKAQTQADALAIAEQRRQFDQTRSDFEPFRQAGLSGLSGYGDLVGINGGDKQGAAINALKASPYYQSLYRNGLESVLQNASATGGIRGGNTEGALANFGSDTLTQAILQQLGNLGGLASLGEGATNSTATFGANATNSISNLLQSQGAARAGSALSQGGIWAGVLNDITSKLFPSKNQPAYGGGGGGF